MNIDQLRTLRAVVDLGTFDAAAHALRISRSAVSQRIRALEADLGRIVVRRTTPARITPEGEAVLRTARQVELLESELDAELHGAGRTTFTLPVAVNADSLATWFPEVLADAAGWPEVELRIRIEDQDRTAHLLRQGEVLGAVTTSDEPVAGCRIEPLGSMRYVPVAAPAFAARHGGDWGSMPTLIYGRHDTMQSEWLRARGVTAMPRMHQLPSAAAFVDAVRAGLAWSLLPEADAHEPLARGEMIRLGDDVLDMPLFWQVWSLEATHLGWLTESIRYAAAEHLHW
jgi:LysR family transcriptional regulator, chromosome initiation inhibitor